MRRNLWLSIGCLLIVGICSTVIAQAQDSPWPSLPEESTAVGNSVNPPSPQTAPAAPQVTPPAGSKGMIALTNASMKKQYLFLFFYKEQTAQTDAMFTVIQGTISKLAGRADMIAIAVTDPMEQQVVNAFGVSGAPMPLVLSIAPTGAVMGGFPTTVTEAQLLGTIGTPAMEETMKALQDRRLVLVAAVSSTIQQSEAAMNGINELRADPQVGPAVYVVTVDPANPNEAKFLQQMQIDPTKPIAQTVMLAPPGSMIGKFMGGTTKTMLLSKLQSSGGCGPGGCAGGQCGPPSGGAASAPAESQGAIKRFFARMSGN